MATLTEDMVTARARGADIKTLRKLNCWGACLSDVSLLQRMPNLEVIAFSVNQIALLADFTKCVRLNELYLRGNCIRDLNQILYLQHLPISQLLLKENPIENVPLYRETVIKALPQLKKLDDCEVTDDERINARRAGKDLIHPELASDPDCYCNQSRSPSPQAPQAPDYREEYVPPTPREAASSSSHDNSPSPPPTPVETYERRNSNYDEEAYARRKSSYVEEPRRQSVYEERRNSSYVAEEVSPVYPACRPVVYDPPANEPEEEPAEDGAYLDTAEDEDRSYHQVQDTGASLSRLSVVPGRSPRTRSSNILSSVLLLIKELDIVGLEVVQVAVASRIHEVSDAA